MQHEEGVNTNNGYNNLTKTWGIAFLKEIFIDDIKEIEEFSGS